MQHDVIIVGGGVSGLATGYWLRALRPELSVVVLEAGESAGGHVTSTVEEGFTVDWGPNALRAGAPDTGALIDALGLSAEVVRAAPAAKRRYVVRRGALVPVPSSPQGALCTPLLSPAGKLRALLEPLSGRGPEGDESVSGPATDESVSGFLRRRFGSEVASRFGEVMVTGLVAGDPERLSVAALFPQLVALERRHGSLLRGLGAQARAARQAAIGARAPAAPHGPAGRVRADAPSRQAGPSKGEAGGAGLFTLRGGLGSLTDALAAALGPAVRTLAAVTAIHANGDGYDVGLAGGARLTARRVVLATPAHVSADLLAEAAAPAAADELRNIPYAGVGVAALGFARGSLPPLPDGFGFLAPRGEGVRSLGVLFSSATFPGQAPEGAVLLRAICGGVLDPGFLDLSHDEAVAAVRHDLAVTLGITAPPSFTRYRRKPAAIPQYELGHAARLANIQRYLADADGLHLIGNAYRGVGVNDCLREARAMAARLAAADGAAVDGQRPEPMAGSAEVGRAASEG